MAVSSPVSRPHTPPFHKAAGTTFAHEEALRAGKANAALGLDLLTDDAFYGLVRAEWDDAMTAAERHTEKA